MNWNVTRSDRIRFWLVERIAGERTIILNATLHLAAPINPADNPTSATMIVDNTLLWPPVGCGNAKKDTPEQEAMKCRICDGSAQCEAVVHVQGCFADTSRGAS